MVDIAWTDLQLCLRDATTAAPGPIWSQSDPVCVPAVLDGSEVAVYQFRRFTDPEALS